ncbi:hypothetical protein BMF94_1526 [Rhodotorula taiwanensis]|uniref:Proteophosphoglycan ppg4 n=1 Tax=Rhodotorula taiwanensis TaxID=741276 RepID=A0A2S5BFC8_9BASI|nr:hypothetical protein BMF94_1526 [Rhodotorula taiwanensis]
MQSPLAAAFDYPVRQDSLSSRTPRRNNAPAVKQHAPSTSTSSSASSSSSSAGPIHAYLYSDDEGHHTRSSSLATDFTTASEHSRNGSTSFSPRKDAFAFSPNAQTTQALRYEARPDSSLVRLRERTRYRSSASFHPTNAYALQGAFGSLSLAEHHDQLDALLTQADGAHSASLSSPTSESETAHLELLAALAATSTTLDTCFCGQEPEEDSIYCSRACAQADALNALCGGGSGGASNSSGAEDAFEPFSTATGGGSSAMRRSSSNYSHQSGSSAFSGSESHYRRIEREETRKATERERAQRRLKSSTRSRRKPAPVSPEDERAEAVAKAARHLFGDGGEDDSSAPSSRRSSRPSLRQLALAQDRGSVLAPRISRSSSSSSPRVTSYSSSVSSHTPASIYSPVSPRESTSSSLASPSDPDQYASASPCIVEPPYSPSPERAPVNELPRGLGFEHPIRPCTPSPRIARPASADESQGGMLVSDIYASYLAATPRGDEPQQRQPHGLLCTPTGLGLGLGPTGGDSLSATPRAAIRGEVPEDEEEDSPTQRGAGGLSDVGLRMLELCASDDEGDEDDVRGRGWAHDESRDSFDARDNGGACWTGGQALQRRMADRSASSSSRRSSTSRSTMDEDRRGYGHTRGKLSFDDVVGILGA